MNLNHLEVFHATATAGTMTGASATLSISQPAVSKQVRQLEISLDLRLFDRGARHLQLTRAGETLFVYTTQLFRIVSDAEKSLADLSSLRRGTLAFGATPTLGAYQLPDVIVHFRRRFPQITTRLEIGAAAHLQSLVSDGTLDAVLSDVLLDSDQCESKHFANETLVVIAAASHPLARKRSISTAALADQPFVVRETGSASRSFAERALAARGVKVHATLSLASTEAIKRAVAGGLGLAVVPELSVGGEVRSKQLSVLRVPQLILRRPLYVTRRRGSIESKAAIAFRCILKHGIRGSLPKLLPTAGLV